MPDGNGQGSTGASKLPLPIRARPPSNMSASSSNRPRRSPPEATTTTPRRSSSHPPKNTHDDDAQPAQPAQTQTPANNTNFRASAPPSSNARYSIRTPGNQVLDFRASRQQLLSASAGGRSKTNTNYHHAPTQFTPHGRAAIRALDSRRAAIDQINTPGRNRRRSMRDQRETPRDVLRALSKTLAPKSKPITTSSSSSPDDAPGTRRGSRSRGARRRPVVNIPEDPDDSDDEFPIDRPRFSLPIDEDADSDGDLPRPPRSSGLEDLEDNFTMQSIEMPRRATLGQRDRFSMRMSMMGSDNGDDGVGIDSAFFPRANWGDDDDDNTGDVEGVDDATLERLDDEAARRGSTIGGRISDFGAIDFDLDAGDQSTVVLAPQVQSSPEREGFSPENEPFGLDDIDDDQPPAFGDDDEDMGGVGTDDARAPTLDLDLDLDLGGGDGEEEEGMEIADLATEVVFARQTSKSAGPLKKPGKKVSRHGITYPSLPTNVVKRLAQRFAGKTKINPDTLSAIMQASDWFFEQLGEDLQAYANHAKGRTTINESDMLTLMRRYVFIVAIHAVHIRVSLECCTSLNCTLHS